MKRSKTSKKKKTAVSSNNLSHLSTNQLMTVTGMSYRTVVKKLKDGQVEPSKKQGRAFMYDAPLAINALFHVKQAEQERLDPTQEKAKLYNQQWRIAKIQRKKLKNDLVEAEKVQYYLETMVNNMTNKMLSLPNTTAKMLSNMKDKHDIVDYLTAEVKEALTDLSSDESWIETVVEDE